MTKLEKMMWGLFAGILILLYLLSSTDLIIKEKKTEVYPVSLIIGDTSDDYYVNFRKGVDQAALDYNVDLSFITLFEKYDAGQQMELVKREIDDGAKAVILSPARPAECARLLDQMTPGSPLIIAGAMFPGDQVKSGISIDHYEAGRKLGEAVLTAHPEHLPVFVFTEGLAVGYNQDTYDGFAAVLSEGGYEMTVFERESEDTFRKAIESVAYPGSQPTVFAALDAPSTDAAAEIIGASQIFGRYVAGLYGTGGTTKLLDQLDKGIIRGIIVKNQFDEGYLCVEKAVEAIRRSGGREQITLDSYYIEKKDLRNRDFEKILYPID